MAHKAGIGWHNMEKKRILQIDRHQLEVVNYLMHPEWSTKIDCCLQGIQNGFTQQTLKQRRIPLPHDLEEQPTPNATTRFPALYKPSSPVAFSFPFPEAWQILLSPPPT